MKAGDKLIINSKEYIFLCKSEEIKENRAIRVQVGQEFEEQVAIFRIAGKLFCLTNICPHRHKDSIHRGFLADGKVTCPEHGWTYDLVTGRNINTRQGLRSLKAFPVFELNGLVLVQTLDFELPKWKKYSERRNDTSD